jgi:peptidoglycan LD-endopeptidase CwlK
MPKFGPISLSKLQTCHLDLQVIFFEVIQNFDCTILEGHRNQEDQDKAFAAGKSQLKYPNGNHNALPSKAVDVAPYPVDFNDIKEFNYFAGYVMGVAKKLKDEGKIYHSIRWGGDWNRRNEVKENHFNDLCHFEILS